MSIVTHKKNVEVYVIATPHTPLEALAGSTFDEVVSEFYVWFFKHVVNAPQEILIRDYIVCLAKKGGGEMEVLAAINGVLAYKGYKPVVVTRKTLEVEVSE